MVKRKATQLNNDASLNVDFQNIKNANQVLRALDHKVRQKILMLIHQNKEITVSDIYHTLRLEQSLTSTFLAMLRKADIVTTRKDGQKVYYSINYDRIARINNGAKIIDKG